MTKPTKDQLEDLKKMADETRGAFGAACLDPDVTAEDYAKLREQYNVARWRYHELLMNSGGQ